MKTSRFSISLVVLLLCGLFSPASAAPKHSPDEEFEQHYEHGLQLYKQAGYEEAVREFLAAYSIRQLPRLLFILGQAHRKLGHASEALGFYELYLKVEPNPKPEIRAELDRYIIQARAMISAAERAKQDLDATQRDLAREAAPERQPERLSERSPSPAVARADLHAPPPGPTPTPAPNSATMTAVMATAPPRDAGKRKPVYKKAWFWGTLGGVVALGVVAGVVAATYPSTPSVPIRMPVFQ